MWFLTIIEHHPIFFGFAVLYFSYYKEEKYLIVALIYITTYSVGVDTNDPEPKILTVSTT